MNENDAKIQDEAEKQCNEHGLLPFIAACRLPRTNIRKRGLSGKNGKTTRQMTAGTAFSSRRYGHAALVPGKNNQIYVYMLLSRNVKATQ
jgi:hypothetical protein